MIYPVLKVEMRRLDVMAFLRHEKELLCEAMQARPGLCRAYRGGLHYGHIAYMFLVGLFAHGPYASVALVVGVLLLLAPIFGEHE